MTDGVPPQGWPGGGGYNRPIRPVPAPSSIDCSFMAFPVELHFNEIKKENSELSTGSGDTEELLFNENEGGLTDFYFDNKSKDKEDEINQQINKFRYFYLVNGKLWSVSLNNKDLYKKYKSDDQFIGNKFKEVLEKDNELALLVQVVNERFEMKNIGKYLFYREIYLHTYENKSIKKLFLTYIGEEEETFIYNERENVRYYRWKFKVHKNRLVFVSSLLKDNFNVSIEEVRNVKNYNDVLKYFLLK